MTYTKVSTAWVITASYKYKVHGDLSAVLKTENFLNFLNVFAAAFDQYK